LGDLVAHHQGAPLTGIVVALPSTPGGRPVELSRSWSLSTAASPQQGAQIEFAVALSADQISGHTEQQGDQEPG
jgi:hypothetical protein